jgi:hypothetical protein
MHESSRAVTLPQCDGKRVAVVMSLQGKTQVFRGMGRWTKDAHAGESLRVRVDGEEDAAILIAESYRGEIAPVADYGCEVCISVF